LEIMRDSRIGSHGALALVLLVLIKTAALERLLGQGGLAWLVSPVLARFLCTLLIAVFPYARAKGLGSVFAGQVGPREVALGGAFAAGALWWAGMAALWGALAALVVAMLVGLHFKRGLGGLTGDGYGAAIELSEAACLVALSLR
jgi:adenosylcobinamide-GDP ribazoletransferase